MKEHRHSVILALVSAGLTAVAIASGAQTSDQSGESMSSQNAESAGLHDFDFFVGSWRVQHRRLKERLANSHEWLQFDGTTVAQLLLGGSGNVDDNELNMPGDPYRAVTLRAFDAKTGEWSIWWLDSRSPRGPLDPPVRGRFKDGVGTFYADDTFNNKRIRVRFIWSKITATSCHWEQAFSPDGGKSWETNWEMDFTRER
jgi:hypothetical protein